MGNVRLFSYKMKDDTGFAPNPFHGILTLANCKPLIRKCKKEGDWIAGFTSKSLNGDEIGKERLIYLMKVTKKISYDEYWSNPEYELKKPRLNTNSFEDKAGDNIYKPDLENNEGYIQIGNKNHFEWNIKNDLSGKFVLVSDRFYYFGGKPIEVPDDFRPNIPKGQSAHGSMTSDLSKIEGFIDYIETNYQQGLIHIPHLWFNLQEKHNK